MRKICLLPLFAGAVMLLSGAGLPAPRPPQLNPQQKTDLDRVSDYLNAIHSYKSNFVQLGPDGQLDQGTLYIQKPGQMRFSYAAPSPTLVVATAEMSMSAMRASTPSIATAFPIRRWACCWTSMSI